MIHPGVSVAASLFSFCRSGAINFWEKWWCSFIYPSIFMLGVPLHFCTAFQTDIFVVLEIGGPGIPEQMLTLHHLWWDWNIWMLCLDAAFRNSVRSNLGGQIILKARVWMGVAFSPQSNWPLIVEDNYSIYGFFTFMFLLLEIIQQSRNGCTAPWVMMSVLLFRAYPINLLIGMITLNSSSRVSSTHIISTTGSYSDSPLASILTHTRAHVYRLELWGVWVISFVWKVKMEWVIYCVEIIVWRWFDSENGIKDLELVQHHSNWPSSRRWFVFTITPPRSSSWHRLGEVIHLGSL